MGINVKHLLDRPCSVCEFHKENGCCKWSCVFEEESTIKALGEELRKARKGIADEKVLIGYNMAVAICNKHLGEVR